MVSAINFFDYFLAFSCFNPLSIYFSRFLAKLSILTGVSSFFLLNPKAAETLWHVSSSELNWF